MTDAKPDPEPEPRLIPQRYRVQFTATQEYVELLERARDLLSHAVANRSIEEVHLRAMRELVSALEKRRYATEERLPSVSPQSSEVGESEPVSEIAEAELSDAELESAAEPSSVHSSGNPRQRGRYTPTGVRRSVRERDGARCAYADSQGRRCRETSFLELHHRDPFGRGGPTTRSNLTIYCRSHNALAAEQDFGRAHMARKTGRD